MFCCNIWDLMRKNDVNVGPIYSFMTKRGVRIINWTRNIINQKNHLKSRDVTDEGGVR